ncbi:hypothetical protein PIB30_004698 [Stylosanthes scabra]|uniref:Uncharacterized protein n=1 Tax=Stylosanthes scabra TaxID=79078 RepID=A0ABU6R4A1_9FABA|nr:hypothetical protein [Stylosanthes scabra]
MSGYTSECRYTKNEKTPITESTELEEFGFSDLHAHSGRGLSFVVVRKVPYPCGRHLERFKRGVTGCNQNTEHPLRGTSVIAETNQLCGNEPTVLGSTHIWSRCCLEFVTQPRLPRVTRCHRYNPAVTRTSCA